MPLESTVAVRQHSGLTFTELLCTFTREKVEFHMEINKGGRFIMEITALRLWLPFEAGENEEGTSLAYGTTKPCVSKDVVDFRCVCLGVTMT